MMPTTDIPIAFYTPILVNNGQSKLVRNPVCQEIPLQIRINDEPYVTLMRTPGLEKEHAVGFCFTDNIIRDVAEITEIQCLFGQGSPWIQAVLLTIPSLSRKPITRGPSLKSSSGSVNRAQILDEVFQNISPVRSQKRFDCQILDLFPERLHACQVLRSKCGATHGSALLDEFGHTLFCAEDVGRHNGLDKLIGYVLLNRIDTNDKLLMLSSRASFEMIQKALRISIPVVASISAPTELALQVADHLQCTYISFLKKKGYYIYTHAWRFGFSEEKLSESC